MATEQLPAATYLIANAYALSGYEIISANAGFEEDAETKQAQTGQFKAEITYMRRQTLALECEALAAATPGATYVIGGTIASGTLPLADGTTASGWKIRNATEGSTKGVRTLSLDLVSLTDLLA
jgi:hypothetical protein